MAREPNYREKDEFIRAVRAKDAKRLHRLVNEELPDVLWGKLYNKLTSEDREWAQSAVRCS